MNISKKNHKHFKTTKNRVGKILLLLSSIIVLLLSCNACSKDEATPMPIIDSGQIVLSDGVTEDDFEKFPGEFGIILNVRNIAKKGYKPTNAIVTVNATNGNYSQTVALDEFTSMGQIKIALSGLSDVAISELQEGVNISVDVKNQNSETIIQQDLSAVVFRSNAEPKELNVSNLDETSENTTIALKEDTPYYIQVVNAAGVPSAKSMRVNRTAGFDDIMTVSTNSTFSGVNEQPDHIINFIPIPGEINTFAIKLQAYGQFVGVDTFTQSGQTVTGPKMFGFTNFEDVQNSFAYENYKFIIKKVEEGKYAIISKLTNQPFKEIAGIGISAGTAGETVYWRIISNSLEWNAENIGTKFLSPILSVPGTDFGANSTLTNCGTGGLSQTIGKDESITIRNIVGWEESFSFTGTTSASVSATVSTEFEAGFFGNTANYSASVTGSLETSSSMTSESSSFNEFQDEKSETIFFERTVTVPPGKASLVYDVAQIYDNTKIQFVQRFRLSATESGNTLSGEELRSQLQFSRFNGVVTQIGPDFLDISIKGTATLGKVLEARSEVQDVPSNCN